MQTAFGTLWTELVDACEEVVQAVVARVRRLPNVSLILDEQNVLRADNGEPLDDLGDAMAGASCSLSLPSEWFYRAKLNAVPLESLPFLEAFARQQIERVTPWNHSDVYVAVAHRPLPDEPGRLLPIVTVVPKRLVAAHVSRLEAKGCSRISVRSQVEGEEVEIAVGGSNPRGSLRQRVSTGLALLFTGLPLVAGACWWQSAAAEARTEQIVRQVAMRRDALVRARSAAGDAGSDLQAAGMGGPRMTLILEFLSAALPDSAYLTQLSIETDRANISGVALNPPQLVPILENTGHFSDVRFSAATTKTQSGADSRFSLEMRIVSEQGASAR